MNAKWQPDEAMHVDETVEPDDPVVEEQRERERTEPSDATESGNGP